MHPDDPGGRFSPMGPRSSLRLRVLLVLVALLAGLAGAPAGAGAVAVPARGEVLAVALDGDRVAWVARGGGRELVVRSADARTGAAPAGRALSPARALGAQPSVTGFAAAGGRVAVVLRSDSVLTREYEEVHAGPAAGPFARIPSACPGEVLTGSVALAPDVLAVSACRLRGAAERTRPVELRDPLDPGRATAPVADDGTRVRAAGPYAAWDDLFGRVVVFDRSSSSVVARITTGDIQQMDLGADGTVVTVAAGDGRRTLSVASPSDPTPRPLPATTSGTIRLAGGRIVALEDEGVGRARLRAVDLAGASRLLARFPVGESVPRSDTDGTSIAWGEATCAGHVVRVTAIDALRGTSRRPRCAMGIVSRRLVRRPGGRLAPVAVSCPVVRPAGCAARVTVRTLGGVTVATGRLSPDGRRSVGLRVTGAGARVVAGARRGLRVRVSVRERGRRAVGRTLPLG